MTGGDRLMATLKTIDSRLASAGGKPNVKVGFLEGSTYPDGTSTPTVAAYNEFGTSRAPPRPYFRTMIKKNGKGWGPAMGKLLASTNYDASKTLDIMGQLIKGQLQTSINETNTPPLAASTIRRKGFDKPLIDTGHMWNSVAWEVSAG